ncbi:MAG: hypothetical protein HQL87_18720 [Magnetococcales bacterium]|nr:hypothetical protein [Magnetococcales bacterium]
MSETVLGATWGRFAFQCAGVVGGADGAGSVGDGAGTGAVWRISWVGD